MSKEVRRPPGMEEAEIVLRPLETRLAKRLGGFLMNAMDLHLAATWFMHASLGRDDDASDLRSRRDAYFHAAVAAYRRCCNRGQRSGRKIQAKDAERIMPEDGAKLHGELLDLGNRLVGHSVLDYETAAVGARCLLDRSRGLHAYVDAWGISLKTITLRKEKLKLYWLLCYLLETKYIRPEIDNMRPLLNDEILRIPPEQLFTLPVFMLQCESNKFNPIDPSRKYPLEDGLGPLPDGSSENSGHSDSDSH